MTLQICISGNVGSGKTTLAKALCKSLGLTYLPQRRPNSTYLNDLFSCPERWAFEAQIAFLMAKAASLISSSAAGLDVILDRSIFEDVHIFSKIFHQRDEISDRAYETYMQVASLALRSSPPPTFLIFCLCDGNESAYRIQQRGQRDFEKLYPEGHIQQLAELYQDWFSTFEQCPAFTVDTQNLDVREPKIQREIADDVKLILRNGLPTESLKQPNLFSDLGEVQSRQLKCLIEKSGTRKLSTPRLGKSKRGVTIPAAPFAYIAAPFTGMALSEEKTAALFELPIRGQIKPGPYRDMLLSIERSLARYGIQSVVPHRDDSGWGARPLRPRELVEWCSVQIQHCSLICAIPSSSSGVHFEIGLARAWQKPMIVFESADKSDSSISRGLHDSWDLLRITYQELSDIPNLIRRKECEEFLRRMGVL